MDRKSIRDDDEQRKLAVKYCQIEFLSLITWLVLENVLVTITIVAQLFVAVNDLRLPFYAYIFVLPIDPALDEFSFNWLLNYLFQTGLFYCSGAFVASFSPFVILVMNHACWLIEATILDVEKFGQTIAGESDDPILKKTAIKAELIGIVERVCSIQEKVNKVQKLLRFIFFVDFTVMGLFIGLCVFTLSESATGSIVVLFGFSFVFSQLFVFCWLGSRITSQIEKLFVALYDTNWYIIDMKQQQDLKLSIAMTQNMRGFNGIFKEVSLETLLEVRRKGWGVGVGWAEGGGGVILKNIFCSLNFLFFYVRFWNLPIRFWLSSAA